MLYFLYKAGRYLLLKLPLEVCYKIALVCADIYYIFARSDRKNLAHNLKIVLRTEDKRLIKKHTKSIFRNFAKYLVDFFRFSKLSRAYILNHVTIDGKENVDKALANGKGVIMLSAHLGNWELGAAVIASLGYPIYAIVLEHKDKRVNDFFLEQRSIADVNVISIGAQLKNCFRALQKNCLLAIVGDRDFSNHGIMANFFGRPAVLPKGPAYFAQRTGARIIPTFLLRNEDDTFKLVFEKPVEYGKCGNEDDEIKEILQCSISVIERYIRSFPGQWFAFYKVWD